MQFCLYVLRNDWRATDQGVFWLFVDAFVCSWFNTVVQCHKPLIMPVKFALKKNKHGQVHAKTAAEGLFL